MNLIRFNGFLFVIAVNISYNLAAEDGDKHVKKMYHQTNFNCTLDTLLRDIFNSNNPTPNSSLKKDVLEDNEKVKDMLGSVAKLYVSNIGTSKGNGSNEQKLVDGIISSINTIKNNFTININNETDATRINETVIIENSTLLDIIPKKDLSVPAKGADYNKSSMETSDGNARTTSSDTKYVEVLTIEPNNTALIENKSSENVIELLKQIMPKFQGSTDNITVVERKVKGNIAIAKSGNVSTIIVAYCNDTSTLANINNTKLKETIHSSETLKHYDATNNSDYNDGHLSMEPPHVDTAQDDDFLSEEANLTQLEQRNVLEAAEYGMQMMHELYSIQEPKLYSLGLWLDDTNPARYVAAFNAPSEDSAKYFRYGYASLQAAKKLQQLLSSGAGGGDDSSLQARTEEAVFPSAGALRNSALLDQCPLKGAPKCPPASKRYRTHDGTCNNLSRPRWGSSMTPVQRFLAPHYSDGLQAPRRSVTGAKLPSPREISALVHEDHNVEAVSITHLLMQWGQFVDHDLTSSSQSRGFNGSVPRCCKGGGRDFVPKEFMHPECMPISVPTTDRFYGPLGVRCLEFVRSSPAPQDDCSLGWREQLNQVSAYLDGSPLYGSSARTSDRLRLFRNGMLQYGRVQQRRPLLPPEKTRKDELCRSGAVSTECFKSGDNRVNEHPGLVAAHIVWLRQHNRMATELAHLNPHWSDEKIYQETRKIVGAMLQHITYNEFLPIVLGSEVIRLFDLEPQKKGFYRNYNPKVNPSPASSFGSAAFRFGHSLVQGSMMRYDRHHRPINNNVSLHEELTNPSNIWSVGAVDRLLLGMVNQPIQKRDEFITEELTNHLFQTPQFDFGMDLAAINIQRGRDHGMAAYTAWREPCGLTEIRDFEDLFRVMPSRAVRKLQDLYRHVDDVDLFTGGMAERPVVGGLVGPTFACIIAQQFSNLRKGDRFWYENGAFDSSFTPAQLQQIRRITLAQVLCKTLDTIDNIQPFVFLAADLQENRRISCANEVLNNFDLSSWIEIDRTLDNNVEFDRSDKITEKPEIKQNPTKELNPDSITTNNIDQLASGSNRLIQTKPLPLMMMTNSTKAQNSITKKKTRPRPHDNEKTDTLDRFNNKTTTKSNKIVQKIDDKLDFRNKSRRYENNNDDEPYSPQKQQYDYNYNNNNDDYKYEEDESNIYQQTVVINNNRNQRPNKFNRPVIAVTENIDKFTYLINYVPKTTPRPWRQTTRHSNYDRDVVKVTYQTYDDTYRRPQPQHANNHQTLTAYFNNRLVQKPTDQYDEYRRIRPESLTIRYADSMQSSARTSDFNPFFTKVTAGVSQKTTTKDEVTFPTTTEQFYRLVTFSHLGTYNQRTDFDNQFTHKKLTQQIMNEQILKKPNSNIYSKDFTLTNDKAYKQDVITTDQFTTSRPPRLSTFFLSDKELTQNLLNRPTLRPGIQQANGTISTSDKLDTTKTPGRYYYAANVLHRYPDISSSLNKTDLKSDNVDVIKENYNNTGRPNDLRQTDIQERSSVDSMTFFEDFDMDKDLSEKGGQVKVLKQAEAHKTHSVAFQVIPSENSPSTWAVYEEKSESAGAPPRPMPAVHSDPHALEELPRPMNLSVVGNISRRKPSKA